MDDFLWWSGTVFWLLVAVRVFKVATHVIQEVGVICRSAKPWYETVIDRAHSWEQP